MVVDPISLTNWHLKPEDAPNGALVVRIVGETLKGQRIVTAPVVRRFPRRLVQTESGFYRLLTSYATGYPF
jgi:hypothetical protein